MRDRRRSLAFGMTICENDGSLPRRQARSFEIIPRKRPSGSAISALTMCQSSRGSSLTTLRIVAHCCARSEERMPHERSEIIYGFAEEMHGV